MATPQEESTPTTGSTPGPSRARAPRTSHACDRCRTLRTKCTGEIVCARCVSDNATCVYNDRKRERNKKTQAECWEQIDALSAERERLLLSLHSITLAYQTQADRTPQLTELIRQYGDPTKLNNSPVAYQNQPHTDLDPALSRDSVEAQGERRVLSDVGSNAGSRTLSRVVDLGQGGGAAGFVGKTSAVTWMARVAMHLNLAWQEHRPMIPSQSTPHLSHEREAADFERFKFYDDEENLLVVDEDYVNPYELPPREIALLLTEAFQQATSRLFLFYDEKTFLEKTMRYTQVQQRFPINDTQWLAQANMAWALGARWLKIQGLHQIHPFDDHSFFYARARALGIDHRVRMDHPSLDLVAALGVLTVYLYSNGSISRAFNISGETVRHAIAHGLHLNLEPDTTTHMNIVFRTRLWNSLQAMEILLAELTGRPRSTTIVNGGIDSQSSHMAEVTTEVVPTASESNQLWNQFLVMAANMDPSLHVKMRIFQYHSFDQDEISLRQMTLLNLDSLGYIDDDIARIVYTMPITMIWEQAQRQIAQLDQRLQSWRRKLPPALEWQNTARTMFEIRAKLEVAIRYSSLQMILHRVNLCEITIQDQSVDSQQMDSVSARACVNAAYDLLTMFINENGQISASQVLPWWRLLHPTCLALSALLLELCLNAQHMPAQTSELLALLPKALDFLAELSRTSKSSSNAYNIFQVLVSKVLQRYPGYTAG